MPGLSFPSCRIDEGIALVSPMGMLVRRIVGSRCTTLPHRTYWGPWTGSWKARRSENGQFLVCLRSIRLGIHNSLRVDLTVTSTKGARCKHTSTGGRLIFLLLLSCGNGIRDSGNGSFDNRSLTESMITVFRKVFRISEAGIKIAVQHYKLPVLVTNQ